MSPKTAQYKRTKNRFWSGKEKKIGKTIEEAKSCWIKNAETIAGTVIYLALLSMGKVAGKTTELFHL